MFAGRLLISPDGMQLTVRAPPDIFNIRTAWATLNQHIIGIPLRQMASSMNKQPQVSVIIPAYNEAPRLPGVLEAFAKIWHQGGYEIIVVDDASEDNTAEVATRAGLAGLRVIRNPQRKGYGGAIKTGIRASHGELIAFLDADGQHRPEELGQLIDKLREGVDMVIGARDEEALKANGWTLGRKFLKWLGRYLVEVDIPDLNSGFRVVRREVLIDLMPMLPNGFSLSTTCTLGAHKAGYGVLYMPIRIRPREGSKTRVRIWKDAPRTLMLIVRLIALFNPLKVFLPVSLMLFFLAGAYTIFDSFLESKANIPDGAVFLAVAGIVTFCFGILADQISVMRRSPS